MIEDVTDIWIQKSKPKGGNIKFLNYVITHDGVRFDYSNSIDNLWNAQLEGNSESTYTVTAPSWSADLASGQSVTIDFIANGDSSATPTNYGIN